MLQTLFVTNAGSQLTFYMFRYSAPCCYLASVCRLDHLDYLDHLDHMDHLDHPFCQDCPLLQCCQHFTSNEIGFKLKTSISQTAIFHRGGADYDIWFCWLFGHKPVSSKVFNIQSVHLIWCPMSCPFNFQLIVRDKRFRTSKHFLRTDTLPLWSTQKNTALMRFENSWNVPKKWRNHRRFPTLLIATSPATRTPTGMGLALLGSRSPEIDILNKIEGKRLFFQVTPWGIRSLVNWVASK